VVEEVRLWGGEPERAEAERDAGGGAAGVDLVVDDRVGQRVDSGDAPTIVRVVPSTNTVLLWLVVTILAPAERMMSTSKRRIRRPSAKVVMRISPLPLVVIGSDGPHERVSTTESEIGIVAV
jgi:hypothetical protein